MPSLSVIIPFYNEAPRIEQGLLPIFSFLEARYPNAELLLVNDGSKDATEEKLQDFSKKETSLKVSVITYSKNRGKGAAVREGMLTCSGDTAVFMDADNATPIEQLPALISLIKGKSEIAIGSRALEKDLIEERQPWWRQTMGKTFNTLVRLFSDLPFKDTQCGFKAFGSQARDFCFRNQKLSRFAFDVELLFLAKKRGFSIRELPVRWRHVEDSRVHPIRDSLRMAYDILRVRWIHRKIS